MTTNILYYILLYLLVLVMRFFKLKNSYKETFKDHWKETFDCSIEIVYTSSGFVIALLINAKEIIPVIIIGYILVIISASYLERSTAGEFSVNTKFGINLFIITLVLLSTVIGYTKIIPETTDVQGHIIEKSSDTITEDIKDKFTVLIPYQDNTLNSHVGKTLIGDKTFYVTVNIEEYRKDKAILKAISIFNDSLLPSPIYTNHSQNNPITILSEKIQCFDTPD